METEAVIEKGLLEVGILPCNIRSSVSVPARNHKKLSATIREETRTHPPVTYCVKFESFDTMSKLVKDNGDKYESHPVSAGHIEIKPNREQSYEKSKLCGSKNWPDNKFITSEYSVNIPFLGKFNINLFRVVWRTAYVVGVFSLTNPFDTNPISGRTWLDLKYVSHVDALVSHPATSRALLRAKKPCKEDFASKDYTILTSRCKGPKYQAKACCSAFKDFACPYAEIISDETTLCAAEMFCYIQLYGRYPLGILANMCKEGKEGLDCTNVKATSASSRA
ncbi:unnamed protein product [Brassica napus]|uniref:(rape) hypothetical protein n=2 Tax=Brassica napus TaxID=3708 RepID=A0A816TZE6_BRANA|nr:unnamed protein product [Brassica napus]